MGLKGEGFRNGMQAKEAECLWAKAWLTPQGPWGVGSGE